MDRLVIETEEDWQMLAAIFREGLRKFAGSIDRIQKDRVNAIKRHVVAGKPGYGSWSGMKDRCLNKNHASFADYGGRGILVCERWMQYKNFLADMGPRPDGCSLDRIDNDGNYEPSNCRWATPAEQSANTRTTAFLTIDGVRKPLTTWAREKGVSVATIHTRLLRGWSSKRAVETPRQKRGWPSGRARKVAKAAGNPKGRVPTDSQGRV